MSTDTLVLLWVAFIGTLFWPINPDAAVVIYTAGDRSLAVAVITATVGQMAMLLLLHFGGDVLRRRWAWLDKKCEAIREKWGLRLLAHTPLVAATSGFTGIPPSVATVLLGSALRLPAWRYLPILFIFRALWFLAIGRLGDVFL